MTLALTWVKVRDSVAFRFKRGPHCSSDSCHRLRIEGVRTEQGFSLTPLLTILDLKYVKEEETKRISQCRRSR